MSRVPQPGDPIRQQEGYNLLRRSYRMRVEVVDEIDRTAQELHCSRSACINDLLRAALLYIRTGDTLQLSELRSDLSLR